MYGVVLVMAMAGGAEAPDCHKQSSCGCYGGGYAACYGGGYGGCYGVGYGRGGCYGGGGYGYGGCYGGGGYGGGGCYGGGGYGGGGCYGGGIYVPPAGGTPPPTKMPPSGEPLPKPKGPDGISAPATIVVSLPAEAKLTIDGYVSKQTSSQRTLVTVPIQSGREFTYTFVAEVRGARQTQAVTVRAGQVAPVNFDFSTAPAAASR
jgi:uncharacterized protein (TIGR03000 family)